MKKISQESKLDALEWFDLQTQGNYGILSQSIYSLIAQFELHLMQNHSTLRLKTILRSMLGFCIYYDSSTVKLPEKNCVYFWPFQFLHIDFQKIIMESCKQNNIPFEVIVFRDNLKQRLLEEGIPSTLASTSKNKYPIRTIIKNLYNNIQFLTNLYFQKVPPQWKIALLKSLQHLSLYRRTDAVIQSLLNKNVNQYHMVGYDLSTLGKIICRRCNELNIKTGRIQNGVVNYRLSKYSEAQEVFVWDSTSTEAYINKGFRGNVILTGNILLQQRQKELENKSNIQLKAIEDLAFNNRWLVAFSGPGHNTTEKGHIESIEQLKNLVIQNPEVLFIIKLHPKDSLSYYEVITDFSNVIFADSMFQQNLPNAIDFLMICDGLITGASSVALDAMALGKAVLRIDPLQELKHMEFMYNNPTIHNIENSFTFNDILKKEPNSIKTTNATSENGVPIILKSITDCVNS